MGFQKNHNLADDAFVRIGEHVGKKVKVSARKAQVEEHDIAEQKAEEIVQMIGAELAGLSPTITQMVLERIPDSLALLPKLRNLTWAQRRVPRS